MSSKCYEAKHTQTAKSSRFYPCTGRTPKKGGILGFPHGLCVSTGNTQPHPSNKAHLRGSDPRWGLKGRSLSNAITPLSLRLHPMRSHSEGVLSMLPFWDPARPLQESPGPSGPKSPKSLRKSLPGPSGPGVQKVTKTVSKESPESQNSLF